MPKAYWIGHVTVDDPAAYQAYRHANAAAFAKFGGRFLVRGGEQEPLEGKLRPRSVVIEFPDLVSARACYSSPEYQAALRLRQNCSIADLVIVEGYDG
ncbi:DUF1330 domain-containing protein [Paracoccus aestuariivivens]|uniref:DUF1330 domain-containing protein n=1 Tax=Paracoccus aestuariivivens TaxID=1820333 RepID=A0A6L6JBN8_9RHOB|nr:DUF1330 domain-containing protein [Paracoccus aestuariivivens]MTH78886.1 DUF1330 domain-containing protein [Paracoccus aestuariivivens]